MVHIDWISVLDHPSLLDPPANTGDAATLWRELRIVLDSEYGSCALGVLNWSRRELNHSSIEQFLSSQARRGDEAQAGWGPGRLRRYISCNGYCLTPEDSSRPSNGISPPLNVEAILANSQK